MNTDRFDYTDDAVLSFFGKGIVVFVSVFTAILFARLLGPAKLGEYFFTLAIGLILSNILAGYGKSVSQDLKQNARTTVDNYFTISLVGVVLLSVLLIIICLTGGLVLTSIFPFFSLFHIIGICGVTISVGFFEVIEGLYLSSTDSGGFFTTPLRNIGIIISQLPLAFLGFSIPIFLFMFSAVALLSAIILVFYAGFSFTKPDISLMRKTLVGSIFTTPVMLLGNLFGRIDIFIIGIAATTTAVGYYEAAYRVLLPGLLISASASNRILKHTASKDKKAIRNQLEKAVQFTGFLAIPVFFISISIPNKLLTLVLGKQFIQGALVWPYIIGLSFVIVLTAYREPFNATIRSLRRPKIIITIQALFLLINIPLSFILVSILGGVGAVIGTAIIEFGLLLTYELISYRYLGGFVFPDLAIEQILAGFVLLLFLKPFAIIYPVGQLGFFIIAILGSIITYITILSIISQEFRHYVKQLR